MNLEFYPSRTLTVYLARLFTTRILAVLFMLVLVLQMLDLLGQSGDILAYPGNGQAQLLHYVSLRIPQLIARFLPYSVLLATIITLATLNQNSEVISMKAAGLSAHQVLAPLVATALVISGMSFLFNERIVTRATASLNAWEAVDYGPIPKTASARNNLYIAEGRDILLAGTLSGEGDAMVMTQVTYYRRDAAGMIVEQLRAPRATYANPGWRLEQPVRFDAQAVKASKLDSAVVAKGVTPARIAISGVDADAEGLFTLTNSIDAMAVAGRRTTDLKAAWWHKLSGPLSAALMPLLGAVAAFGLARSGQLLIRAVTGMALGFAYFVFDNAALAMGNFGGYPPFVAAWAPFLLFLLIGETVLIRTEE
ncbi:lipopolysaccharide export system permease protein [Novosphingobium chloroacetimidivorans]|uniref:Lipopolysaccharide export system permease protein n=1 Tax=Novosphingobium chloroacetimidivorans TaxID=1428314 RepID=A0A7W7K6U4_9SPHN|nr:LPS export ABC transporter permease LptG [Novosphingobium chloroacetimidivorans]MBB4857277.1 lipopolysaccharide export system permease protein [Novosphingobium chloroacetimidivorans]